MTIAREQRLRRFHHYGPWTLVIGAIALVVIVELARHHAFHDEELLFFVAFIPSVILHEISHGVVAYWLGDDTAKKAGRLSLNPLRHIDPFGSVLLPIILVLTSPIVFGWAKPVPIRVDRLRHPRNDAVLVGLAGPVTNIILALIAGFAFRFTANLSAISGELITRWPLGDEFIFLFGVVNVLLAVFNLIPIPPLDGSSVIERFLPARVLPQYYRMRMMFILVVLFLVIADQSAVDSFFNFGTELWGRAIGIGPVTV